MSFIVAGSFLCRQTRQRFVKFSAHHEVLRYLEDFAHEFGLNEMVRYQTEVRHVGQETDGKWMVKHRSLCGKDEGGEVDEIYDVWLFAMGITLNHELLIISVALIFGHGGKFIATITVNENPIKIKL